MCFSARVQQKLDYLSRRFNAEVDWDHFEELFQRRLRGEDVKVARQLERNFERPGTEVEERTKAAIDEFSAARAAKWETEIFAQRRRLANAQVALTQKSTKRAQEDERIATEKIAGLLAKLSSSRQSDSDENDGRIFPMMYAPVLVRIDGHTIIRPMRYACRLAGKPASYDQRFSGTYNARRDNLSGFWKPVFGRNHAVMVISGFFENVPQHLYEHRDLAPDEKARNFVLQFTPRPYSEMLIACVWDCWIGLDNQPLHSFAAVTDEPPDEIRATGHQRCVISLREANLQEWLAPESIDKARLEEILSDKDCPYYEHVLAA